VWRGGGQFEERRRSEGGIQRKRKGLLESSPNVVEMGEFGGALTDAQAKTETTAKAGGREVKATGGIDLFEEELVKRVKGRIVGGDRRRSVAKADQTKGRRSKEFKGGVSFEPRAEGLGEIDVVAKERLKTGEAVGTEDKPEFEGAKPPS